MSTHSKVLLTPEQYLEIERLAEWKSECWQGEMFAMSGAAERHNLAGVDRCPGLVRVSRRQGRKTIADRGGRVSGERGAPITNRRQVANLPHKIGPVVMGIAGPTARPDRVEKRSLTGLPPQRKAFTRL